MNMADQWKQVIGAVAPTVATAIFGPLGGLVANLGAKILLGKDNATPDEIVEHVMANQTPETFLKLKELEAATQLKEKELGFRFAELEVLDRKDARAREVALGIVASVALHALAFFVLAGFFATVWWVFMGEMPEDPLKVALVGAVVGYVSAKADQVIAYFFGSSAGSKAKTDALAKALGDASHR